MVNQFGSPTDELIAEIRQYLHTSKFFPPLLDIKQPETVRQAQQGLAALEAGLDRVMAIQHDTAVQIQAYHQVIQKVRRQLLLRGDLTAKSTKPATDAMLLQSIPMVLRAWERWQLLERLCGSAQKRLHDARQTVKLQESLDSNVRWDQYRNP